MACTKGGEWARKKALLIVEGKVRLKRGTPLPVFPIRSSGGPTSSAPHVVLSFGPKKTRVKVALMDRPCRFELKKGRRGFCVMEDDKPFLKDVTFVPAVMHAPGQAFVNIEPTCDRGCLFCTADTERPIEWDARRWVKAILDRYQKDPYEAVAITAGVPNGVPEMVDKMVAIVKAVRKAIPDMPIGVEPNAVPMKDLKRLKAAGADELKVNVQTVTVEKFKIACPGLDRDDIFVCLRNGVQVFGRGMVSSNVIIGLGETEKETISCISGLARMGVAANLRVLRVNEANRARLERALGTKVGIKDPARIERLVRAQKAAFKDHGLRPQDLRTMCHRCACCDLTAGVDI